MFGILLKGMLNIKKEERFTFNKCIKYLREHGIDIIGKFYFLFKKNILDIYYPLKNELSNT